MVINNRWGEVKKLFKNKDIILDNLVANIDRQMITINQYGVLIVHAKVKTNTIVKIINMIN
jgi:hypothetical protein